MSGHSKWAQIKRQKGAADIKRGALYTKLGQTIAAAVREGGKDPSQNVRLRLAIERARAANMPNATIERAIQRGSGELTEGRPIESVVYEAFGPHGVAFLIEAATDNKNRITAEIRKVLGRFHGNIGGAGSVQWMFELRGRLTLNQASLSDQEQLSVIDAGAVDVVKRVNDYLVLTNPQKAETTRSILSQRGFSVGEAEVAFEPKNPVTLGSKELATLQQLVDELESLDDVTRVSTNASS